MIWYQFISTLLLFIAVPTIIYYTAKFIAENWNGDDLD